MLALTAGMVLGLLIGLGAGLLLRRESAAPVRCLSLRAMVERLELDQQEKEGTA